MRNSNQPLIGNNIRKWRIIKGISRKEFAERLHLSKATVSKIENDKQTLTIPRLQQIADCLTINAMQLFVDPLDLISGYKK